MTISRKKKAVAPAMASPPPLPAGHVPVAPIRVLGKLIRRLGGDPDAVFRSANIDKSQLAQPQGALPIAIRGELIERAAQETGCEHFGLLMGEHSGIREFGAAGQRMLECSHVGSALETFAVSWLLHNSAVVIFIRRSGDQATLGYAAVDGNIRGMPQLQDGAMAISLNMMREMLGADWRPAGVNLMRPEPHDSALYAQFFGANCRFNATHTELIFPASTLDFQFQNTDAKDPGPVPHPVGDYDWSAYVKRVAYRLLLEGKCSQKQVAAALGISDRTLVRRLANWGISYQQLLEVVRFSASRAMIRETNLSFAEIAAAVGYNEPSSFTRAFQRWSGMSPAQWGKSKDRQTSRQSGKPRAQ